MKIHYFNNLHCKLALIVGIFLLSACSSVIINDGESELTKSDKCKLRINENFIGTIYYKTENCEIRIENVEEL